MMPSTCSIYDAAANTWSVVQALGTSPLPRSNHAAALLGENLVIIHGGRNGTERLSDICALRVAKHYSKSKKAVSTSTIFVGATLLLDLLSITFLNS